MEQLYMNTFEVPVSTLSWYWKLFRSERIEAITHSLLLLSQLCLNPILASFHSILLLLYLKEGENYLREEEIMMEKVCMVVMSRRNTKCIEFAMQFILNNCAFQK